MTVRNLPASDIDSDNPYARRSLTLSSMLQRQVLLIFAAVVTIGLFSSCATSDSSTDQRTVDDVFREAKDAFDDDDLLTAQGLFDVIKLQYPASAFADDAQYYLAEINFRRGEYILAAFNYALVRRSYPQSEFAREALYKSAVSYYQLALPPDRDQDYTKKAIVAFSEFSTFYPADSLALQSAEKIRELRDRLAEKYWDVAQQYKIIGSSKSRLIYLDAIIGEYPESKWYEEALVEKAEILLKQQKNDELRAVIALYRRTVRTGDFTERLAAIERDIK